MEHVKVVKVKKTADTFTPKGTDKVLYKHLVALEDGRKCWTFSEKFEANQSYDVEIEAAKSAVEGVWYDHKIKFPPKEQPFRYGGKSPESQKSIVRQHSQEMALRQLQIEVSLGLLDEKSYNSSLIWHYADAFEKDAGGAEVPPVVEQPPVSVLEENAPADDDEINLDDVPF